MKNLSNLKKKFKKFLGINKQLDITKITDYLYVGSWPKKENIDELKKRNIGLIISLIFQKDDKELGQKPFKLLSFTTFDTPWTPLPMKVFYKSVEESQKYIKDNKAILVYCKSGMNRSVIIAAAILVSQGYTADEALELIRSKRLVAKGRRRGLLKQLYKFESEWNKKFK